jgi:DNA-binding transcriptional LysR family regulator
MRAPNHLNALRAFEAAARHLSYVAAADELNVTPAAIGQLVRGLEEVVGVELFRRSPSGPARLELTDQARAALPDLQAGFDRLSTAFEHLKASRPRTAITVTVPPAFADKWLLIHDRSMALESTFPTWRTWLQNAGHADIDCERGLQINDSAAVIQAAIAGSGVAIGRTTLVATDLAEGRLVRPFGDDLAYEFAYYIVHRPQADKAPAVAAFKTWLLAEAAKKR